MMRWNVPLKNLHAVHLAADVRLGSVDYCNDHIWELQINDGLPACVALSTSFGLRARRYLMFPLFSEKKRTLSDPAAFERPPIVEWALPSLCQITYSPLPGLDVEAEYWIPSSQTVCGRVRVINRDDSLRTIRLAWIALLTPVDGGATQPLGASQGVDATHRMAATHIQRGWALAGKTANLAPVLCMSGGAEIENVPYPSLSLSIEIPGGSWRDWHWAQATLANVEDSYRVARAFLGRNWDAERTRILMANTGLVEVESGKPSWDLAFAISQQVGLSLFNAKPAEAADESSLPFPSLLQTRQPDQGYSLTGNGSDYPAAWNGQAPQDVRILADLLLPAAPDLIQGMLVNYFACQDPVSGMIDHRPGLGGKRSRLPALPILADLTWRVYQQKGERAFLEGSFQALIRVLEFWFNERDEDRDGLPEWDHPLQFEMPHHPVFSPHSSLSQGAAISFAESPGLGALLYRECLALRKIAMTLGVPPPSLNVGDSAIPLAQVTSRLQEGVRACWDETAGMHTWRDRDTHGFPSSRILVRHTGAGAIRLDQTFPQPLRLLLRIDTDQDKTKRPRITLRGSDYRSEPCEEVVPAHRWKWVLLKTGRATSRNVFSRLDEIVLENINDEDTFTVTTPAYEIHDASLLLPLWAEMLDENRARTLIEMKITRPDGFWSDHGLRTIPAASDQGETGEISIFWNTLIAEGLLAYGFREEAACLLENLMNTLAGALENEKSLRASYSAVTGKGSGDRFSLTGLAPLGLFLDVLGVRLFSPWKIGLTGVSPFPQTIRIVYRGLTLLRSPERTTLTFPDDQIIEVTDPDPCIISLEA